MGYAGFREEVQDVGIGTDAVGIEMTFQTTSQDEIYKKSDCG